MKAEEDQRVVNLAIGMKTFSIKRILQEVPKDRRINALINMLDVVYKFPTKQLKEVRDILEEVPEDGFIGGQFIIKIDKQAHLDVFSGVFSQPSPGQDPSNHSLYRDLESAKRVLSRLNCVYDSLESFLTMSSATEESLWFDFKLQLSLLQELHKTIGDEKFITALENDAEPESENGDSGNEARARIKSGDPMLRYLAPGIAYSVVTRSITVSVTTRKGSGGMTTHTEENTDLSYIKHILLRLELTTASSSFIDLYDCIQMNLFEESK